MASSKDDENHSARTTKQKMHHIDNLRSSLTALVIVHHTATSYGGIGRNVYQASQFAQGASPLLTGFNAVNHSFFMSTFMYLAGHFSHKTLQRKPKETFIKDRLYRLGLPTLAYTVIGAPICLAVSAAGKGQPVGLSFFVKYWTSIRQAAGPVWFTATLLAFDLSMVAYESIRDVLGLSRSSSDPDTRQSSGQCQVRTLPLVATLSFCSIAEFFARLWYPVGVTVPPLKLQLGNVAPYIAAYVFGANNEGVENVMPTPIGIATCLCFATASSVLLPSSLTKNELWKGGWTKAAASFSIWGNFAGYLIGSALLQNFSRLSSTPWTWINRYSYPAFLVHMPVLTTLGVASDRWRGSPVQKAAIVGTASVVLSWVGGSIASELWASFSQFAIQLT